MTESSSAGVYPDDAEPIRWVEVRARRLSSLLRATDLPAPATGLRSRVAPRVPRARRARMAAAIALLVSGVALVPPVRAWIRGVTIGRTAGTSHDPTAIVPDADAGSVSFAPAGSVLTIRVPVTLAARLVVEVVAGERVTAAGQGGRPLPGLMVSPNELRLGAVSDSAGEYLVRVPFRIATVRVVAGQGAVRTFHPSTVNERWTVPLSPSPPR